MTISAWLKTDSFVAFSQLYQMSFLIPFTEELELSSSCLHTWKQITELDLFDNDKFELKGVS